MKVEEQIDFLTKEINFNLKYMINLKQRIKYCKKEMKKKAILVNKKLNLYFYYFYYCKEAQN